MISLYRHGHSILHRAPAWAKLAALSVLALVVSVWGHDWRILASFAVFVAVGFLMTGLGIAELWRQLVGLRWIVVIMAVPQLIFLSPDLAVLNTARVCLIVLLAALVTLTTPIAAMLDVIARLVSPFERFGALPTKVSLLLSLTITTIPVIASLSGQIREAMIARGGPRMSFRIVLPLLVGSLQHGDQLSDSLRARGVD